MKRNILIAVLLVTLLGNANTKNNIFTDVSKVKVEFLAVKKGNTLNIKDASNTLIYKENIKKSGELVRTFDFSDLPEGDYIITLVKDFEIVKKSFTVFNGNVSFSSKKEVLFKPVIRTEENKILLSKLSFSKNEMDVEIYFEGELIHKEDIKGSKSLSRIYQLSAEKTGNYTFIVNTDDRSYSKNFNL